MGPFTPDALPPSLRWETLVPQISRSNRAIALYSGILLGVPDPRVLLSPITTAEAVLSSRIEGTQATLGEVLKFEAGENPVEQSKVEDIQEIFNYRRSLRLAEQRLEEKPFNLNLLLELHAVLLDSVRGRDKGRGRFRTVQNWIGPQNTPIEKAHFVPPEPLSVPAHLDAWEKYYHADAPDPLVQLAIVHAQFEVIHPFVDGNGRLGRILVPLFLYEKKVISQPVFYLSEYFEEHRDEYVQTLRELGGPHSWDNWVRFFLGAIEHQALRNAEKAKAIMELYERLKQQVLALTHSQYAVPLLDRIFEQPIFKVSDFVEHASMPSKPMVYQMVNSLRDAGILLSVKEGRGRTGQILVLAELVNLCEGREVMNSRVTP